MKIIALDGIDGAGKTTHAKKLAEELPNALYIHLPTSELPYTLIKEGCSPVLITFFFLYDIAGVNLAIELLQEEKDYIILDRWVHSFLVYQKVLRGFSREDLEKALETRQIKRADITIFLDTPKGTFSDVHTDTAIREGFAYYAQKENIPVIMSNEAFGITHEKIKEIIKRSLK